MKTFKIVLISFAVFLICGAPSSIHFHALRPALIDVPEHLQTLLIINRSECNKSVIEKILTAELPNERKVATRAALEGLSNVLQNSNRFNIILSEKEFLKGDLPDVFPEALEWDYISRICEEYGADGVLALEVFNTNYIIVTGMLVISSGFRFYDPVDRIIIDQEKLRYETYVNESFNTIPAAISMLIEKDMAVKDAGYQAGRMYAEKFLSTWYPISRIYYKRAAGDADIKIGARMMEVNNWDEAINSLTKASESKKMKTRGRAAHNLAVVYEILGDLETAKFWAQEAWGKYKNKDSKNYSFILSQRIDEM